MGVYPGQRRIGFEQEFFLVDEAGVLRGEADRFLSLCRDEAEIIGLDPACFKGESVKHLVEITTPPSLTVADLAREYLTNVRLALGMGEKLGLRLYPLATYPLSVTPVFRDDLRYQLQALTVGRERYVDAGRCAGTHLHLELPPGTVDPFKGVAPGIPEADREEMLNVYNLATALDPALVALTRSCPFYEGEATGLASRTVHYRGSKNFGWNGVYTNLPGVSVLRPYVGCVEDLAAQHLAAHREWLAAMDRAGVERRLFFESGGGLLKSYWGPVRLSRCGTVEIRSMDSNYPESVLPVVDLICNVADRIRLEGIRVEPSDDHRAFELRGDTLRVPGFDYLSGDLFYAAATEGAENASVSLYLDSILAFTGEARFARLKTPSGEYRTTESEILEDFASRNVSFSEREGLRLVRSACESFEEEVSSLYVECIRNFPDANTFAEETGVRAKKAVCSPESALTERSPAPLLEGLEPNHATEHSI